jgi:N-methylhydantoinase B/oxoprolinase/acetone carboxylase alpha subunit
VQGPGDDAARDVGTGEMVALRDARTEIEGRIAGGSGFGQPWDRPLEAVQAALDDGDITREGAGRDYGIVYAADGTIDPVATARRRAGLQDRADRTMATTTGGQT